jgi:hypothetical protein
MEISSRMFGLLILLATANSYTVVPSRSSIHRYHINNHERYSVAPVVAKSSSWLRSTTDRMEEEVGSTFAGTLDSPSSEKTPNTKSWQEDLEQLLDPKLSIAQRQVLISDLINANAEIRESVNTAIRERKVRVNDPSVAMILVCEWCSFLLRLI